MIGIDKGAHVRVELYRSKAKTPFFVHEFNAKRHWYEAEFLKKYTNRLELGDKVKVWHDERYGGTGFSQYRCTSFRGLLALSVERGTGRMR